MAVVGDDTVGPQPAPAPASVRACPPLLTIGPQYVTRITQANGTCTGFWQPLIAASGNRWNLKIFNTVTSSPIFVLPGIPPSTDEGAGYLIVFDEVGFVEVKFIDVPSQTTSGWYLWGPAGETYSVTMIEEIYNR